MGVPLGQFPLLHGLRQLLASFTRFFTFVHPLPRSYGFADFPVLYMQAVRLFTFSCRSGSYHPTRYHRDLPGSVHEVYRHMPRVSDSVGPVRHLPLTHPPVLPSVNRETVGTPIAQLSKLNTWPMSTPVNDCPSWLPNQAMTRGQGGWPTLPHMIFSVTPPCQINPAYPPTLHKNLYRLSSYIFS